MPEVLLARLSGRVGPEHHARLSLSLVSLSPSPRGQTSIVLGHFAVHLPHSALSFGAMLTTLDPLGMLAGTESRPPTTRSTLFVYCGGRRRGVLDVRSSGGSCLASSPSCTGIPDPILTLLLPRGRWESMGEECQSRLRQGEGRARRCRQGEGESRGHRAIEWGLWRTRPSAPLSPSLCLSLSPCRHSLLPTLSLALTVCLGRSSLPTLPSRTPPFIYYPAADWIPPSQGSPSDARFSAAAESSAGHSMDELPAAPSLTAGLMGPRVVPSRAVPPLRLPPSGLDEDLPTALPAEALFGPPTPMGFVDSLGVDASDAGC